MKKPKAKDKVPNKNRGEYAKTEYSKKSGYPRRDAEGNALGLARTKKKRKAK